MYVVLITYDPIFGVQRCGIGEREEIEQMLAQIPTVNEPSFSYLILPCKAPTHWTQWVGAPVEMVVVCA